MKTRAKPSFRIGEWQLLEAERGHCLIKRRAKRVDATRVDLKSHLLGSRRIVNNRKWSGDFQLSMTRDKI